MDERFWGATVVQQFSFLCGCGCGRFIRPADERGRPRRFLVGHGRWRVTTSETRFWAKVDRRGGPGACWPWMASRNGWGYGDFKNGRRGHRAHRLAWELTHGPIPDGLFVCHRCDVPACCNPAHLFLGTPLDNVRDMDAKGRDRRIGPLGERAGAAVLTAPQVRAIRARYDGGDTNISRLARDYGVHRRTIQRVVRHQRWTHVD